MMSSYAGQMATMPDVRAMYEAQAGVGRAREGDLELRAAPLPRALRYRPLDAGGWGRLATSVVPPMARRRWPPYDPDLPGD